MEIIDYFAVIRRRFWILMLVPLLAGAAVWAIVVARPPQYSATATVAAPWLVGNTEGRYGGPNGTSTLVSNFLAGMTLPQVLDEVALGSGVPMNTIKESLTATPVGDSAVILVQYSATDEAEATTVANQVARETMLYLFEPPVTVAQDELQEAQRAMEEADNRLADFAARYGLPANLDRSVVELTVPNKVDAYQRLAGQKARAHGRFSRARESFIQLSSDFRTAQSNSAVTVTSTLTDRRLALIRNVAVAVGVGLFLAVSIVLLIEVVKTRDRELRAVPAGGASDDEDTQRRRDDLGRLLSR